MCGIWASVGLAVPSSAVDRVAHRGPDGQGWICIPTPAGPVHLGHRLLAITGHRDCPQPVVHARSGWLTYNGEIYNGEALRVDLAREGHDPGGAADTWVVLAALNAWGPAALERLEGMFALAFLDAHRERLIVARDRFGIKPLYALHGPHGVAFASEIKQFLSVPEFRARLHERRAADFLDLGVTDHTAETMWRDVTAVPPGTAMTVSCRGDGGLRVALTRWYSLPGASPERSPPRLEEFAATLRAAVSAHARVTVPAGVSLSGGLDSSAVACFAPRGLPCFSLIHDDPAVDESPFARAVAAHLEAPLLAVRLDPAELPEVTDAAVRDLDEPFPSLSVVAQWAVFRAAAAFGIKVMLTGQGADELLGGYPLMLGPHLAGLLRARKLHAFCREVRAQQRLHHRGPLESLRALVTATAHPRLLAALAARGWADQALSRARLAVLRSGRRDAAPTGLAAFRRDLLGPGNLAMLLRYEDRTAMAHGVEARPPFLDHRVVESALRLGGHELIVGGITKAPLRAAASGVLPAAVLHRLDKRGFPTPEAAWVKGPLREYVARKAASARTRFPRLVSAETVASVTDVLNEVGPLRRPIWRVAALGAWADAFGVEA
jgi:asparagine synthase (glutamine-hydrolysing)